MNSAEEKLLIKDILKEIKMICREGPAHSSREKARSFFEGGALPDLLSAFIKSHKHSMAQAAKALNISPSSLKSILAGGTVSENILFRIRNSMELDLFSIDSSDSSSYLGDWRLSTSAEVQAAIQLTSSALIALKNAIQTSNSLTSEEPRVDQIQVAQLVAMLEATLASLKAPLIEKGQTEGFFGFLRKFGRRIMKKKSEEYASKLIDASLDAGQKLVEKLAEAPASGDVTDILI